uniref:Phosphoglycolate phosphatase n=1 Tax=Candidatus Methanophaga sp. ANME-1 ERB7 TaxID=2759913 RepID=A0A7G9Z6G0_9EURY|nr:hypothetical protein BCMEECLJ_00010 [Methanosarcinales archaeon ANME-1 ERB7]
MIKTVVFDLDGVLLDSVGLDMAISVRVFKKFGYSITKPDEQYIIGWHPADRISLFAKQFHISEEEQRLILEAKKQDFSKANYVLESIGELSKVIC